MRNDWSKISDYRGQNSNMHLTEALMAAFEATGESEYLRKAESIASFIIGKHAADLGYRVAEHFDEKWNLFNDYRGSEIFRPAGSTPGHWLEWSRLLLQLWELGGRKLAWLPDAAARLFRVISRSMAGMMTRAVSLHAGMGQHPAPAPKTLVARLRRHWRCGVAGGAERRRFL